MTPPLIEHLLSFNDTSITVASNILKDAQALATKYGKNVQACFIDTSNTSSLETLIEKHTHVISFIPPWMHGPVCRACLKVGRNLSTSSYVSNEMLEMDKAVKEKGLIFMNECGLDPGIDILGTMKVVHQAKNAGLIIKGYESYCGGLPVAEHADNPLGYKFSWNPGAAIKASRN